MSPGSGGGGGGVRVVGGSGRALCVGWYFCPRSASMHEKHTQVASVRVEIRGEGMAHACQ